MAASSGSQDFYKMNSIIFNLKVIFFFQLIDILVLNY